MEAAQLCGVSDGPCLLIVAAPIKRPYIWDLAPSVSAVRFCRDRGLRVYLLEWKSAPPGNGNTGLAEYADQAIGEAVALVARETGTQPFLIGHSLGGTFAAIFVALAPEATPVVMLTMVDDEARGYTLGAAEYLIKPIDRGRLKAVLQRYCGPRGRVLVDDDDPDVREWTREMISRDGFQVIEACDGHEALARLETELADVILLDLLMPEMDGFVFLDELRRHDQLKELPVVVLTAKDLTEQDHAWLNGGVARVLQKGALGRDDILNEFAAILARRASRPALAMAAEQD